MTFSTRPDSGEDYGVCSQVQQHQARQVFQVAPGGTRWGKPASSPAIQETGLPGSEEEQV